MSDIIMRYEDYLIHTKHASDNTVASYMRDLRQYASYLGSEGVDVLDADQAVVSGYMGSMKAGGKSAATISRALASIKSLYIFAIQIHEIEENPIQNIKIDKAEKKLPQILTGKEVELLLQQPKVSEMKGCRDKAMLEVLYATGIRVSEVAYITVEAVQQGKAEIALKGKIRTILLPGKLRRKLLKYAKKQKTASGAIFRTKSGKELGRRQIWAELKGLCKHAGVEPGKVFPHNLRHLFATVFYRTCRDIAKLADLLGHSSIETTRIYLVTSGTEHQREIDRLGLVS